MPISIVISRKQDALSVFWSWIVFLFFRLVFKGNLSNTVLIFFKKPCVHLEPGSKVQTREAFLGEKEV
jgi:hypothetical protein